MMAVDKASEADAMSALQKLTQREQEAEKKAKRQFKGLFDKNPGEISGEEVLRKPETTGGDIGVGDAAESGGAAPPPSPGFLSRFWPLGRRFFTAAGINKCSIL